MTFDRIAAFAPHTDDIEIGCGASIAKFINAGAVVYYVAFSICEEWVPEGFAQDALLYESRAAASRLGVKESNVEIHRFRATRLSQDRQKIFEIMERVRTEIQPALVFCPSLFDTHQDHATIAQEATRVFKASSVFGYEMPRNNIEIKLNGHVQVSQQELETKIEAIRCFESQEFRGYTARRLVESLARVRGLQTECEFAEAFEVIRYRDL